MKQTMIEKIEELEKKLKELEAYKVTTEAKIAKESVELNKSQMAIMYTQGFRRLRDIEEQIVSKEVMEKSPAWFCGLKSWREMVNEAEKVKFDLGERKKVLKEFGFKDIEISEMERRAFMPYKPLTVK